MVQMTDEQRQAVETKANKVLIIAGAGTGKTRVLTNRVKYLLENGADPRALYAITYTNMATNEMKARLKGVEGIEDCFIGTIHSLAYKILKSTGKRYKVLSDEAIISIVRKLISKHFLPINIFQFLDIKAEYDKQNIGEDSNVLLHGSEKLNIYKALHEKTTHSKVKESIYMYAKKNNYITFEEMIELAIEYFETNNIRLEHLLVDEFQDVGNAEFKFIESLKSDNVYFVGDDWQSIFSFKGSNVNIMLNLNKDPNYEKFYLTKNFRNPKMVLNSCNRILNKIFRKIEKKNEPMSSVLGSVKNGQKYSLDSHIKKGVAILVRNNKEYNELLGRIKHKYDVLDTKGEGMKKEDIAKYIDSDKIKCMTVHQSKGLEFEDVILYSKSLKLFDRPYKDKEEELKVMYVAMTRTKNSLVILN